MKSISNIKTALISAGVFSLLCHTGVSHAAVSQQPLTLVESVAPNLIFTLDSSGSMNWGFAPDNMGVDNSALRNTRRVKSSTFNPLYYNPEVTYRLPVKLNNDGTPANTGYSTSFNNAYNNGYNTGNGSVDLRNNYRVTWNWDISASNPSYRFSCNYNQNNQNLCYVNYAAPTGHVYRLAQNPSSDFTGKTTSGVPAYYYVYDRSLRNCNNNTNSDNCYRKVDVGDSERQNFANWYSFYRLLV